MQGLVFEEERPPPPNRARLAPMLEFVSAQTGVPVVAVGGGAGLGREPQVKWTLSPCSVIGTYRPTVCGNYIQAN